MTLAQLAELAAFAKDLTVGAALILVLWGGARQYWVWGHHYSEALRREEWWRDYATSLRDVSEQAVRLAERRRRQA